jgi:hypothetical protein
MSGRGGFESEWAHVGVGVGPTPTVGGHECELGEAGCGGWVQAVGGSSRA